MKCLILILAIAIGSAAAAQDPRTHAERSEVSSPAPRLPVDFEKLPRKESTALVFAHVLDIDRRWERPGLTRKLVTESCSIEIESIDWRGAASGIPEEPTSAITLTILLRGHDATPAIQRCGTLRSGAWYWLAIEPEPDSSNYSLLAAREAPTPRFDLERALARHRSAEDHALVVARVDRIEKPSEREGWLARLEDDDLVRVHFEIERFVWHDRATGEDETRLDRITRECAQRARDERGGRPFVAPFSQGFDSPHRSYFAVDRRYWLVLREGFYKVEAFVESAVAIPTDRAPVPLDLFESFRADPAHALFVGRVLSATPTTVRTGVFSMTPGETLRVEILALPWGETRESMIPLAIGETIELANANRPDSFLGPSAGPGVGTLSMGSEAIFQLFSPSPKEAPRITRYFPYPGP